MEKFKRKYLKYYYALAILAGLGLFLLFTWDILFEPNNAKLEKALIARDTKEVKALINNGANPNAIFTNGHTPLFYAVLNNDILMTKFLLSKGADANSSVKQPPKNNIIAIFTNRNNKGSTTEEIHIRQEETPLSYVKNTKMLKLLMSHGARLDPKKHTTSLIFYRLMFNNNISRAEKVKMLEYILLKHPQKIFALNHYFSIMQENYFTSDVDIMDILIKNGADVNSYDRDFQTPLSKSLRSNHNDTFEEKYNRVAYLINKGADVNKHRKNDTSALKQVVSTSYSVSNKIKLMKLLLKSGAKIKQENECGGIVLAVNPGYSDGATLKSNTHSMKIIDFLIKNGADINTTNSYDNNSLIEIIKITDAKNLKDQIPFINFLIKKGINFKKINLLSTITKADLKLTIKIELLKFFIKKGVNPNEVDKYNRTALMFTHNYEIAELLVKSGANVNAKDKSGNTALHCYIELRAPWDKISLKSKIDLIELLIKNSADINIRNNEGKTIWSIINSSNRFRDELKDFLKKHGAKE